MKSSAKICVMVALLCATPSFAQYSNATLNGPWFFHYVPLYPYNDSLDYMVFDGNGNIIDGNMFTHTSGISGNYSVTQEGAISATLMIDANPYPFSGQLVSQNVANIGNRLLSRVTNPGALADSLTGLLSTANCGQRSVTFRLNSQGQIISASGLIGPVSGRIYTDSGVFSGHVKTGDTGGWDQFSICGYYSNNSLNGRVGLDMQGCGNSSVLLQLITGVFSHTMSTPITFHLSQNYPNPFNPSTTISFSLPSKSFVSLKVFDVLGREVEILLSKELLAGDYSQEWNAVSSPSGVYFYRLQAGTFSETRKLVLTK